MAEKLGLTSLSGHTNQQQEFSMRGRQLHAAISGAIPADKIKYEIT